MPLNKHFDLIGKHAFLSPSKYYWLNYDRETLFQSYDNAMAAARGTKLHAMAKDLIDEHIKLRGNSTTLAAYVNDAIGYGMTPEQPLYFSENCFGTADSILYKPGVLRIHDLKTGATPAHMEQLEIYAALFCLEYDVRPGDIGMELRLYQNDDKIIFNPTAEDILPIMDKIISSDKIITELKGVM